MDDELESTWKSAVVPVSNILSQQLTDGTKKNHRSFSKETQPPGQESNPPKYDTGVLTTVSGNLLIF